MQDDGHKAGYASSYGADRRGSRQTKSVMRLAEVLKYKGKTCGLVLVLDDLDCRDPVNLRKTFHGVIKSIGSRGKDIPCFVGFAPGIGGMDNC